MYIIYTYMYILYTYMYIIYYVIYDHVRALSYGHAFSVFIEHI